LVKQREYIQIATPYTDEADYEALKAPVFSGWLTQGARVKEFETRFSGLHGVKYSLATTSCTTALHLALKAVGVEQGDTVIVPSFTWVATANVVETCGARTVFCDVDRDTYNINIKDLENKVEELIKSGHKPKAVIPVHLFGLCADMGGIMQIAQKYDIKVIEDAACAVSAQYKGEFAGGFGDIGCFSFHPRKIITTGEGGMCTTNSEKYSEIMNCLRNHGASVSEEARHVGNKPYIMPDFNLAGFNYRMSDLQGAIGITQLDKLEMLLKQRKEKAAFYDEQLRGIEWLITPVKPEGYEHSYQSYVCYVDEEKAGKSRNEIMEFLHNRGIATRPGTMAVHELGYYRNKYGLNREDCPVSSDLYAKTMSIPLHNNMSDEDYEYVIQTIKEI